MIRVLLVNAPAPPAEAPWAWCARAWAPTARGLLAMCEAGAHTIV